MIKVRKESGSLILINFNSIRTKSSLYSRECVVLFSHLQFSPHFFFTRVIRIKRLCSTVLCSHLFFPRSLGYNTALYVVRKTLITLVRTLKRGHDELRSDLYTDRNRDCSPVRVACLAPSELAHQFHIFISSINYTTCIYICLQAYIIGLI